MVNMVSFLYCLVYYFVYGISAYLIGYGVRKNKVFVVLGTALIVAFAAFRVDVGTDYKSYVDIFNMVSNIPVSDILISKNYYVANYEKAFIIFTKILTIFNDVRVYFGACAFLILIPFIKTFDPNDLQCSFPLMLFIFLLNYYTAGFNVIRQSIAVSLIFWGSKYIFSGEKIKFLLAVLLATLFHKSAIVTLPLVFFWNAEKNMVEYNFKTLLILSTFLLVIHNIREIIKLVTLIPVLSKYRIYAYSQRIGNNYSFYYYLIKLLIMLLFSKYMVKRDGKNRFYILCYLIATCFSFSGFKATYFARMAAYFSIFEVAYWGRFPYIFKKQDRKCVIVLEVLVCVLIFYLTYGLLGHSDIIPYRITSKLM